MRHGASSRPQSGAVRLPVLRPSSASMHKTALYQTYKEPDSEPHMKAVSTVHRSLEMDAMNLMNKYGSAEPNHLHARFNVRLPQKPQHDKYSWRKQQKPAIEEQQSSDDGNGAGLPGGLKFNMATLQSWFRDIDRDDSGVITQRELIVALRKQQSLLDMFCAVQGQGSLETLGDARESPKSPRSPKGVVNEELPKHADRREDIHRIREVLKEVDTDGSGSMEWDEFVDFFRRAGLLLEYKTQKERNRTTLCDIMDAQREEEEEEATRKETTRRAATQAPGQILAQLNRIQKEEDEEDEDEEDDDLNLID